MDSLSGLRCLVLHDDNDPEKSGQEYGKSIFDMDKNMRNSFDSDLTSNDKFESDRREYPLDRNDLDNTHASATITNSLQHTCNLDLEKLKQLQQDEYITKLIAKCKSTKIMRPPITWMSMLLLTERSEMNLIFVTLLWFLMPCSHTFFMKVIMHWDTMVPPDCTILVEGTIIANSYINIVTNTYAHVQNANK